MLKSLQYIQNFGGLVIDRPSDKLLTISGQMNEGKISTLLGFKGIPKLAEELIVERNLSILEYAGGRLHLSLISSPRSLDLIRAAKKKGLKVTCDVAFYLLVLDDSLLTSFDTNLKVNPPLRDKEDITFFWKAVADDTIDAIVTDHNPQDDESKKLEFDLAEFGMIGLETAFAALNTHNKKIRIEKIIQKMTEGPRNILNLPSPPIAEGEIANLTVFDTETEWQFTESDIRSKSKNTPFKGKKFKGKVIAVFNKKKHYLN
jgi:dihydroorotase